VDNVTLSLEHLLVLSCETFTWFAFVAPSMYRVAPLQWVRQHNYLANIRKLSNLFLLLFNTLFSFPPHFFFLSLLFSSVSMFLSIPITSCLLRFIQFSQPSGRREIFPSTCVFIVFPSTLFPFPPPNLITITRRSQYVLQRNIKHTWHINVRLCLPVFTRRSICLSVCLSVRPSVNLSTYLSTVCHLSIYLSIYLSVYLSIYPSAHLPT
jgi:hypothetical protein